MMTLFNLGSINADFVYQVPHLPAPGETLAATSMLRGLGGKGANMSVAAAPLQVFSTFFIIFSFETF